MELQTREAPRRLKNSLIGHCLGVWKARALKKQTAATTNNPQIADEAWLMRFQRGIKTLPKTG